MICPTAGVAAAVHTRFPGLATEVMPYALTVPGDYLTAAELAADRAALTTCAGWEEDLPVAVLAGGWWPHKDPATVIRTFALARTRWGLVAAGHPLDPRLLAPLRGHSRVRLHVVNRDLALAEMRRLYTAADVAIIKIDAERAEAATTVGLEPHLDRLRPDAELVIEVSPRLLRRQGRNLAEVTGPLTRRVWHPYLLPNDYQASSSAGGTPPASAAPAAGSSPERPAGPDTTGYTAAIVTAVERGTTFTLNGW